MKRLFIAVAAAVPVLVAGVVAVAHGEGAATPTAAAPSKLTICHKTGSATNPWRRITVSSRALANPKSRSGRLLRGHLRHTGDAVVVGTAACPAATETPAPTSTPPTKITICHKTGSASNPYRRITISSRAVANPKSSSGKVLRGHMRHAGDLLMPGVAPCPSGTSQPGQGIKLTADLQPVQGATGSGSATVTIRLGLNRLCAKLVVSGLTDVTAAHIHLVSNDAVVVPLATPTAGTASGCLTVEKAVLQRIVQSPGAFYVNVHTVEYPNGQVQGRLTK
ncbi:MAG TPA: CHRD domain-containing protein [Gaiellaceae bacterium]